MKDVHHDSTLAPAESKGSATEKGQGPAAVLPTDSRQGGLAGTYTRQTQTMTISQWC
ncbi:MAG: hypothetical protein JWN15_1649 [Firmicutes bacterium]|nr:hypothetical protein [Bacillota bacterium]